MKAVQTALQAYYNDHQAFPASPSYCTGLANGSNNTWFTEQDGTTPLVPQYIKTIPVDPSGNDCYCGDDPHTFCYNYIQTNGGQGYELLTQLENTSDSAVNGGQYGFAHPGDGSATPGYVYVVVNP